MLILLVFWENATVNLHIVFRRSGGRLKNTQAGHDWPQNMSSILFFAAFIAALRQKTVHAACPIHGIFGGIVQQKQGHELNPIDLWPKLTCLDDRSPKNTFHP